MKNDCLIKCLRFIGANICKVTEIPKHRPEGLHLQEAVDSLVASGLHPTWIEGNPHSMCGNRIFEDAEKRFDNYIHNTELGILVLHRESIHHAIILFQKEFFDPNDDFTSPININNEEVVGLLIVC